MAPQDAGGDRCQARLASSAQRYRLRRTLVCVGDVLLDVTVPDRATASIIRAAIETAIPTDAKSGVELTLPPKPQPGAAPQPDYRLSGIVVIDGLSDSEAAETVDGALRTLPEIEYRRGSAGGGVAAFVVCLRGRPPMWELHAVCASWREGSEAALVPYGVHCEGFGRVAVQGAPYQRAGDTIVDLAVRASDEVGARQRATKALETAHVGLRRFVSVTRRG